MATLNINPGTIIKFLEKTTIEILEGDVEIINQESSPSTNSYAVDFNAVDCHLTASSDGFAFGDGDYTMEFLSYIDSESGDWVQSGYHVFLETRSYSNGPGFVLYLHPEGSQRTLRLYDQAVGVVADIPEALSVGVWNHIAVTRSSGIVRFFVNGLLKAETSNYSSYNSQDLLINAGYDNRNSNAVGKMSNLRIVKGQALYTSDFSVPSLPLTSQGINGTVVLLALQNKTLEEGLTAVNNPTIVKMS